MRTAGLRRGVALALVVAAAAAADPAEPGKPAPKPPSGDAATPAPATSVGLDSLLRLPPTAAPVEPRTGGATRQEWQQRFATARGDVDAAKKAIDQAQQELGKMVQGTDAWQMSAPGTPAGTENSPVSYKLRAELRRQREELAAAEKRLTELEVEANLAGVPSEWIAPEASAPPPEKAQDPVR